MGKFDGMMICTDLDGTLFKNDKTISKENIEAIEYFKREGGYFTFVTGRMPNFVDDIAQIVKPNAPIGCVNGGGLYDYKSKKYLWKSVMPDSVSTMIRYIDERFSNVGIQVCTFEKSYFSKDNISMQKFREVTHAENHVCHYAEIKEPIAKIIFGSESDEEIRMIEKELKIQPSADEFDFIRSEETFYEILPKGIGKGTAIINLCNHLNIDIKKTVAIGDYNNDISMFKVAGIGIAVSNACQDALSAADYITVSNEEHAIAKVIFDLDSGTYNQ